MYTIHSYMYIVYVGGYTYTNACPSSKKRYCLSNAKFYDMPGMTALGKMKRSIWQHKGKRIKKNIRWKLTWALPLNNIFAFLNKYRDPAILIQKSGKSGEFSSFSYNALSSKESKAVRYKFVKGKKSALVAHWLKFWISANLLNNSAFLSNIFSSFNCL